jgi:hypothetical protein
MQDPASQLSRPGSDSKSRTATQDPKAAQDPAKPLKAPQSRSKLSLTLIYSEAANGMIAEVTLGTMLNCNQVTAKVNDYKTKTIGN